MYSSGVCISPPCAQPRQSAGMPAASAALASVEAATSSSGSPSRSRTRRTVASSGWRRSRRPAGRRPSTSTSSVERRLDRQQPQRTREARDHGLVERALLDHELGVRRDRIDRRAALDAPDVRARLAPRRAAEAARDPAHLVDRARAPAVGPGVASRPAHGDARAQAPDRIHGDVHEAVALQREHELRLQLGAGGARPREVAEPLLADRERDGEALQAALAGHLLDDLDRAHDGGGVVADARAAHPRALEHGLVRHLAREHRVDVREQQHARSRRRRSARSGCRRRPHRRRPGAPSRRRSSHSMRSPSSNVGAGTRASASRSSRASSTALTPRGRYQHGDVRPRSRRAGRRLARSERRSGLDRRVHAESEVAGLGDQHHVLDRIGVVEPLLDAERGDGGALGPEIELHLGDASDRAHLPDGEEHVVDARGDVHRAKQIGLVHHAPCIGCSQRRLESG